jgi:signal transduction histidine kinase
VKLTGRLIVGACLLVVLTLMLEVRWGRDAFYVAIPLAIVFGIVAGQSMSHALRALRDSSRAIAERLPPRLPTSAVPEIDEVAQALRLTDRELAERFADLRREKAEAMAIVDAMVEGVIAADSRGRTVLANRTARELLGYGPWAPLPDLPVLFRVKAAREAVAEVMAGKALHDREVDLDGRIILMNARPLVERGAVLVLHDLTDVRRLEAVRRDFVANVSHELKTPLTSISGYAETLAGPEVDEATRRRFVGTILSNAHRMMRLVDDLLDLSRIEAGRWTPAPGLVAFAELINEGWEAFRARATARAVSFVVDVAPDADRAMVDPDALRQILANLFDNALRYVPEGGTITCRTRRENGGVTLSVTDNGIGIPAEHLPRIFERFYRVDPSRSRDAGGTGLGLSIVKHMVEAHGGRVWAVSVPREATTISCWFPEGKEQDDG